MGAIELDMKTMFGSNLILLLLVNLAFASLSDNVPEEEANRVRRRGPSSGGGALEKRTQLMEECGGDLACPRQDERVEKRKKSRRFWPRPFPTRGGHWQEDSTKTFLIWRGFAEENPVHGGMRWRSRLCPRQDARVEEGEEVWRRGKSRPPPVQW